MMSPNHEYTISFVFDLAKSMRVFPAFHMKILGQSFLPGCPRQDITFFFFVTFINFMEITLSSHLHLSLIVIFMIYSILT